MGEGNKVINKIRRQVDKGENGKELIKIMNAEITHIADSVY